MRDRKGYVAIIIACFIPVVMSLIYLSMHTTQSSTNRIIFENAVRQAALEAARNYMCGVSLADQKDYTERCAATTFNAAMKSLVGLENDVIPMKEKEIKYAAIANSAFGYYDTSWRHYLIDRYDKFFRTDRFPITAIDPDADETEYFISQTKETGRRIGKRTSGTVITKKIFYREGNSSGNTSMTISEDGTNNLKLSAEGKIGANKYKASFTATRPHLNADIVIGIPANNAAFLSDNAMYGTSVSVSDDTLQTPFYQIKAACKKFIREMLSFKNCGIGLIPYSGTVSLEGKITTQSHGSYNYENYAATNPQVPISESYKLSCNSDGGPLTYTETATTYGTGIMHRADLITYKAGGDTVNSNVGSSLLSTVTNATKFMAFPRYIAYGGHANIAAGYASKYKRNEPIPLPMLGLTEKKLDIYRYCSFMSTFFYESNPTNHSSFVYLPVMFGMSMLENGFMARDGYKVQGNGNKKILILFVNQPDLFHPRELTYLGYSNDKSHLNLIDGDLIDYRNELVYENGYYMNPNQTTTYQKNTSIKCTYKKDEMNGLYTLKMPQPANLKIIAEGTDGPCCVIYKNNGHGDIEVSKVEKAEGEGTVVVEDEQDGKAAYKVPVLQNGSSYTITVSGKYDCPVIVQLKLSGCELDMDDGATQGDHKWHIRQDEEYVYLCVGRVCGETIDPNLYNSVFSTSVEIRLKIQSEPTQWQTLSYQGCYLSNTECWSIDQHAGVYSNKNSTFDTGKIYNVKSYTLLRKTTVEFTGSTHNLEANKGTQCIPIRTYYKDSKYDNSTNKTDYVTFTREYGYTPGTSIPEGSTDIKNLLQYVKLEPYTSDSIGPVRMGWEITIKLPAVRVYKNTGHQTIVSNCIDRVTAKDGCWAIKNEQDYFDCFLLSDTGSIKAFSKPNSDTKASIIIGKADLFGCCTSNNPNTDDQGNHIYWICATSKREESNMIFSVQAGSRAYNDARQLSYIYFEKTENEVFDTADQDKNRALPWGYASASAINLNRIFNSNTKNGDPGDKFHTQTLYGCNVKVSCEANICPSSSESKIDGCEYRTATLDIGYHDKKDAIHLGTLIYNPSGSETEGGAAYVSFAGQTKASYYKKNNVKLKSIIVQGIAKTATYTTKDKLEYKTNSAIYIYKYPDYYHTSGSYATVDSVSKDGDNGIVTYDSANNRWICIPFGTLKLKITYAKTDVPVLARIECYKTRIDGYTSYLRTDSNYYFLCRNYNLGQYDTETITISEGSISAWRLSYASNILVGQSTSSNDLGCRSIEYLKVNGLPDGYSYPTASTVNTPAPSNPYYIYGTNVKATPFFKKTDETSNASSGTYVVSEKMNNLKVCAYVNDKTAYIAFNCTQAKSNATNCSAELGQILFSCANKKTRKAANIKFNYFNMTGGTTAGYKLNNSYNSIYVPREKINGNTIDITLMNTKIIQIEWSNNLNGVEGMCSVNSPDYNYSSSSTPGIAWHESVKNAPYSKSNSYCNTCSWPLSVPVSFKYDNSRCGYNDGRLFYNTLSVSLQNLLGDYNITWAGQEGTSSSIQSTEFMTQYSGTYNNSSFSDTFNFGTSRHFQMSSADETNNKNNELKLTFTGRIRIKTIEATNELNRILFGAGYQDYDAAKSEPTIMPTEAMRSGLTPDIIAKFNETFGSNGRIYVIHYRYKPEDYENTGWDPEKWSVYRNYYNVTDETDLQNVLSEIMYEVKEFAGYQDAQIVAAE